MELNIVFQMSELLVLTVHRSTEKSKVVVFRNSDHWAAHEKWFINITPLKVEVEYTYLSIVFSMRLRKIRTQNSLATKAKTAFIRIGRSLKNVPILLYGAEIWGMSGKHHSY